MAISLLPLLRIFSLPVANLIPAQSGIAKQSSLSDKALFTFIQQSGLHSLSNEGFFIHYQQKNPQFTINNRILNHYQQKNPQSQSITEPSITINKAILVSLSIRNFVLRPWYKFPRQARGSILEPYIYIYTSITFTNHDFSTQDGFLNFC